MFFSIGDDGISAGLEGSGDQLWDKFCLGALIHLGGAPADPGSNPGRGENFYLTLKTQYIVGGQSSFLMLKMLSFHNLV